MSILDVITNSNPIVYNKGTKRWLQVTKEVYENNTNTYRVIEKSEINPVIWHGVRTGDNITPNSIFKQFKDKNGKPMLFGDGQDGGVDGNETDTYYDFDGFTYPHSIYQADLDFLLGEPNNVFTNYSFSSETLQQSIWGFNQASDYYYGVLDQSLSAVVSSGVMDILKTKDFATKILEGGIVNSKDITLVSNFFKIFFQQAKIAPGMYDKFYDHWEAEINFMKRNLVKGVGDLSYLFNGISEGIYTLDIFAQKVDVVTSFILDYGEISLDLIQGIYPSATRESAALFIEYPVIKNYSGGSISSVSEEEIGEFLCDSSLLLPDDLIWRASQDGAKIYSNPDLDPDAENKHVPSLGGKPKDVPVQANQSQEENNVRNFLLSNTTFKGIELDYNGGSQVVDIKEIQPEFFFSIRNYDGIPYRLTELDGLPDSKKLTYLDSNRENLLWIETHLINQFLEFGLSLQDLPNSDIVVDLDQTIVNGEIKGVVWDFTRTFDQLAFDEGKLIARIIGANKVNQIKTALWYLLSEIFADDMVDENVITGALKNAAKNTQKAASLPYEEEELSKEELAERQKIIEQCALLLNLKDLSDVYNKRNNAQFKNKAKSIHNPKGKTGKGQYFGSRFLQFNSSKAGKTMTSLYSSPNMIEFLRSTPEIQALLIPKIKIQKVIHENSGIRTIDVPFNSATMDTDNINPINYKAHISKSNYVFRGGASGIKNITFDFDGETPATAQKYVKSTMSLKFQDFRDIIAERDTNEYDSDGTRKPGTFRYLDLIINTTPLKDVSNTSSGDVDAIFREYYNPVNYCIKIDVGWNYSKTVMTKILKKRGLDPSSFFDAIDAQNKTFLMSALDHDLKINNDGSIDLNINYFSFTDSLLNSYKFNALTTAQDERLFKEELVNLLNKVKDGQCSKQQLAKLQAAIEEKRALRLKMSLQNINSRLSQYKLIRSVNIIDPIQSGLFQKSGVFTAVPTIETDTDPTKSVRTIPSKTKKFVFLGDLLYVLLDCLFDKGKRHLGAENIAFALTDFEFSQYLPDKDGNTPEKNPININMASIPIALDFFKEWFTDEIIASERANYPVMSFIMVMCNKLIGDLLTEVCFNKKSDKTLFFRQANLFGSKNSLENFLSFANHNGTQYSNNGILNAPVMRGSTHNYLPISTNSPKTASEIVNYVVIYADFKKEAHGGTGDAVTDDQDGIYHFYLGADSGLLKTASFSKTNIDYLRESRMMRFKGIQDFAQLTNVYNVNMSMVGNFLLYPGMEIYINPYSLGGEDFGKPNEPISKISPGEPGKINFSSLMGIGGYHLVKSVKVSIGVDKFETTVDAQFIFGGDVDGNDNGLDGIVSTVPTQTQTSLGSAIAAQEKDTASCQKVINVWETNNFNEGNN